MYFLTGFCPAAPAILTVRSGSHIQRGGFAGAGSGGPFGGGRADGLMFFFFYK